MPFACSVIFLRYEMCASIDSSDSQKAPAAVLLNCVLLQWLVFKIPKSNNYDVEEGKTGKEC